MYKRVKLSEFKEFYNIKKTNSVVGWTPDYVGPTKGKKVKTRNWISLFTLENIKNIRRKCSQEFINSLYKTCMDERVVFSPGYDTCSQHLQECFRDNTTNITVERIFKILSKSKFCWFNKINVSFTDVDEIKNLICVNQHSFSGHYTSKLFGNKKEDSDYEARNIASLIFENLKKKPIKNTYLWSVLGREKDIKISKEGKVSTRVVMCNENPSTTLLMWFSQKIALYNNSLRSIDLNYNLLREFDGYKANKLKNFEDCFDYKLEADWTFFDSNIDTNFLIAAGLIITNGLPKDYLHNNIRYYIIKSIVTKYVVVPPGVVIELNRANASGHPFTTLVNCVVNLIYWALIGYKIYGDRYAHFMRPEVYGDDSYVYFKKSEKLRDIDKFINNIGLKSAPVYNEIRPCNIQCDKDYDIDFLKRRLGDISLEWNHKKMFDRLIYQTKNRDLDTQIELLDSYYQTCRLDEDLFNYVRIIFNYVKDNYWDVINIESKNIVDKIEFQNDFSITDKDDKFFNFYKPDSFKNNYDKFMKIYNFSIFKSNQERMISTKIGIPTSSSSFLLYLLGISYEKLEQELENKAKFYGRPPPEKVVEQKQLEISKYWRKVNKENIGFLKRRIRGVLR